MSETLKGFIADFKDKINSAVGENKPDTDKLTADAEKGDAEAQLQLGKAYYSGSGIKKDHEKAFMWLKRSAENGNAEAQLLQGFVDFESDDKAEAEKRFRASADQGNITAQYALGALCEEDFENHKSDVAEALKWYRKAADQGFAEAQCALGLHYYCGSGVGKDYGEVFKWFKKAADQGNDRGEYLVGNS
ncbi:sel1 repeat family protein [bacterium]|nr:sel1 repeat family protein [bacterium]